MVSDAEFKEILKNVPRSYDDFVNGFGSDVEKDSDRRQIMEFIRKNPDATSSDVLEFYTENLWNEEDDYDEDTVFYDDDGEEIADEST